MIFCGFVLSSQLNASKCKQHPPLSSPPPTQTKPNPNPSDQLYTGRRAYSSLRREKVIECVAKYGMRPSFPSSGVPLAFSHLANACWATEPALRPEFGDIAVALKRMLDGLSHDDPAAGCSGGGGVAAAAIGAVGGGGVKGERRAASGVPAGGAGRQGGGGEQQQQQQQPAPGSAGRLPVMVVKDGSADSKGAIQLQA